MTVATSELVSFMDMAYQMFLEDCKCDRERFLAMLRERVEQDDEFHEMYIEQSFKFMPGYIAGQCATRARKIKYENAIAHGERPATGADIQNAPGDRTQAREELGRTLFDTYVLYRGGPIGDATFSMLEDEILNHVPQHLIGNVKHGRFVYATMQLMKAKSARPEQTVREVVPISDAIEMQAQAEREATLAAQIAYQGSFEPPTTETKSTRKRSS